MTRMPSPFRDSPRWVLVTLKWERSRPSLSRGTHAPRVFRLPEEEAVINRMGFPGKGCRVLSDWEPETFKCSIAFNTSEAPSLEINLGKNKDTPNEEAVLDYLELLQCFAPYADYLAINISSPNTVGLRQLQGRAALEGLLTQLHAQRQFEEKKLNKRVPLLVKLAPDLSESELDDAVDVILSTHMDGIIVTNTTLARGGTCVTASG